MKLIIPYPKTKAGRTTWSKRFGLNAIYSGKHPQQRKKDSTEWHDLVKYLMLQQRVPKKMMDKPATIRFYWNDRLDLDNHAYMRKMIIDALKGWVITDDDRRYVKRITEDWHDEEYILVEVSA